VEVKAMTIRLWIVMFFGFLTCGMLSAIDDDKTAEKINVAVQQYEKAIENIKNKMLEDLTKKAKVAQKKGDLDALKMLELEKENLEKKNELPKTFKTDKYPYQNEVRTAQKKVDDAFSNGKKEYTMNGKIALATSLEERRLEFQKGGDPFNGMDKENAKKTLSDILKPDSTLSGILAGKNGNGPQVEIKVTITERDGDKYKGTYVLDPNGRPSEWTFEGVIKGEQTTWKTKTVLGKLEADVKLILKKDMIEGTWTNSANDGGPIKFKLPK
jgi:hypothetical protein